MLAQPFWVTYEWRDYEHIILVPFRSFAWNPPRVGKDRVFSDSLLPLPYYTPPHFGLLVGLYSVTYLT